jgi:hyaluronan synthase
LNADDTQVPARAPRPHRDHDVLRSRHRGFVELEQPGLAALVQLAGATAATHPMAVVSLMPQGKGLEEERIQPGVRPLAAGLRDRNGSLSGSDHRDRSGVPLSLAPGQAAPGALTSSYVIPRATFRPGRRGLLPALVTFFLAALLLRHFELAHDNWYWPLVPAWFAASLSYGAQWVLSLRDRPRATTAAEDARLARMRVVVNVPVFNEDPVALDRCIYSLVNQARPPQRVDVVDDGSTKVDYSDLRDHWARRWANGCEVTWSRQPNGGKKVAQAKTFADDPGADIFITVDSDTCLDHYAIWEGLKPFADRTVASVAGFELVCNASRNWLTFSVASRNILYQLVTWGAQSATGDTLTNRGPYALYRAWIVREIIPAYINETFFGHHIKLGDDAALTLFSRDKGRTVQQVTAFGFAMHPEDFSHHFRQWTRWMRGSIVRDCWRLRYLPFWSYGWWVTVYKTYCFLIGPALPILIALSWPASERTAAFMVGGLIIWSTIGALRILQVRRDDESRWFRLGLILVHPAAVLWCFFVLRWIRFFGLATFLRQGWVTRVSKVEVAATSAPGREAAPCDVLA